MKVYGLAFLLVTAIAASVVNSQERNERQAGEIAGVVVPIIVDFAEALFKKILENWEDPDNIDVVFIGRAFRIHKDGGTQVTVTDRASHVAVTIKGATLQASTNTACQELVKALLLKGVMSVDDLHLPPTLPPSTLPPCVDQNGESYCRPMVARGYCVKTTVFGTFMADNCYKACGFC